MLGNSIGSKHSQTRHYKVYYWKKSVVVCFGGPSLLLPIKVSSHCHCPFVIVVPYFLHWLFIIVGCQCVIMGCGIFVLWSVVVVHHHCCLSRSSSHHHHLLWLWSCCGSPTSWSPCSCLHCGGLRIVVVCCLVDGWVHTTILWEVDDLTWLLFLLRGTRHHHWCIEPKPDYFTEFQSGKSWKNDTYFR